jgi:ubiquinone/menaquinone biosynthesis C-methylase UbiE
MTGRVYSAVNENVLAAIPHSAMRLLDLGCGSGTMGAALKKRQPIEVTGVTKDPTEAELASKVLDHVWLTDASSLDSSVDSAFDVIVCSHFLEHLVHPETVLRQLLRFSKAETLLVIALPNVLHWRQRAAFLGGRFEYQDGGLMDETHLRFYDWRTAGILVQSSGWRLLGKRAFGHFPVLWRLPWLGSKLDAWGTALAPGLIGFEFVMTASPA